MPAATKSVFAISTAQTVAVTTPTLSTNVYDGHTHVGIGISGTVTNTATVTTATTVALQASGDNTNFYQIDQVGFQPSLAATAQAFSFNQIPDGYAYFKLAYSASAGAGFTVTANAFFVSTFA